MKRAFIPAYLGFTILLAIVAEIIGYASGATDRAGGFAWLIILWMVGLFVYFLPAYIAWQRSHHALLAIFITNLFLGWTFLGWVGALIWSCMPVKPERQLSLMERALIERNISDRLSF